MAKASTKSPRAAKPARVEEQPKTGVLPLDEFRPALISGVTKFLLSHAGDERASKIAIEALSSALATSIALSSRGQPEQIVELVDGVAEYLAQHSSDLSRFNALASSVGPVRE